MTTFQSPLLYKHIAKVLQDNATFITDEDLNFLYELERRPAQTTPTLKKAAISVKGKIKGRHSFI